MRRRRRLGAVGGFGGPVTATHAVAPRTNHASALVEVAAHLGFRPRVWNRHHAVIVATAVPRPGTNRASTRAAVAVAGPTSRGSKWPPCFVRRIGPQSWRTVTERDGHSSGAKRTSETLGGPVAVSPRWATDADCEVVLYPYKPAAWVAVCSRRAYAGAPSVSVIHGVIHGADSARSPRITAVPATRVTDGNRPSPRHGWEWAPVCKCAIRPFDSDRRLRWHSLPTTASWRRAWRQDAVYFTASPCAAGVW